MGMFSKKNTVAKVEEYSKYYNLVLIDNDPYDQHNHKHFEKNINILPENITGMSTTQKGQKISQYLF